MSQRRTTTLGRGFVFEGALRVNWYANVSMRTFGNSFSTASATSFAKRRYGPDGTPPSSAIIALHFSHVQYPRQSFCETWMKSADGSSRRRFNVSLMYSAFISSFARQSCFGSRFPFTSEYHSGCFSKYTFGGRISKKEWYALWRPLKKYRRWLPPSSGGMNLMSVSR